MESLLFRDGRAAAGDVAPPYAGDLRLDALVGRLVAGREQYDLAPFFWERLRTLAEIEWRQETFRDLARPEVRGPVDAFAAAMRGVRGEWARATGGAHPLQRQSWQLRALLSYGRAAEGLDGALAGVAPRSPGLRAISRFLHGYTQTPGFRRLRSEAERLVPALAAARYRVQVRGSRVRVSRGGPEPDYGQELTRTFARFGSGPHSRQEHPGRDEGPVTSVETRILEGVAALHPELFAALAAFCEEHREALDPTLTRFDREVQFFLSYLDLERWLSGAGLEFSYPRISEAGRELHLDRSFDLALAAKLTSERHPVVANDVHLAGAERLLVVTGPNQGGKTTFARAVGQVHHLAALGCPVPGAGAEVPLCDAILTHFPREEDTSLTRGRLEDDLIRMRELLACATPRSLVVLNEVFGSTTLGDALTLNRRLLERLVELDLLGVCVTFLDELSRLGPSTVSLVGTVDPEDPAHRTFRVLRRRADGRAYALAIAEKYRLAYDQVRDRVRA